MKKTILFIIVILLTFVSCSKEDEQKDILYGTVWMQDIGDKTYWFNFYDKETLSYTETELGDDPFNYLPIGGLWYKIEGNDNAITIYKFTGEMDPNTGYAQVDILLTGYLRNNKIFLGGDGINGEGQVFELAKYQAKK